MGLSLDRTEVMQNKNTEQYQKKPRRNLEKFGDPEKYQYGDIQTWDRNWKGSRPY